MLDETNVQHALGMQSDPSEADDSKAKSSVFKLASNDQLDALLQVFEQKPPEAQFKKDLRILKELEENPFDYFLRRLRETTSGEKFDMFNEAWLKVVGDPDKALKNRKEYDPVINELVSRGYYIFNKLSGFNSMVQLYCKDGAPITKDVVMEFIGIRYAQLMNGQDWHSPMHRVLLNKEGTELHYLYTELNVQGYHKSYTRKMSKDSVVDRKIFEKEYKHLSEQLRSQLSTNYEFKVDPLSTSSIH